MAVKKPDKNKTTTPTTRGASGQGGAAPTGTTPPSQRKQREKQVNAGFETDYEAALAGLEVFVKYDNRFRRGYGPQMAVYKSAGDLLAGWLSGRHSDKWIRDMQRKMWEAGLYGNMKWSEVNQGAKDDEKTLEAYTMLLRATGTRNKFGDNITKEAWLDERAKYLAANGLVPGAEEGDKIQPFRYQPAQDTETLRRTLTEGMTEIIGRSLSPEETDAIVRKYEAAALSAARSAYDVGVSEGGGVAAAPPNLETMAVAEAERLHPDEVKAKRMANLSEQWLANIQSNPSREAVVF